MKVNCLKRFFVPFDAKTFIAAATGCPDDPETVNKLWRLFEPVVYWREGIITKNRNGVIETSDAFKIESKYVSKGLQGCKRLVIMAVTAGEKLSGASESLIRSGKLYEGAIADMLGSYAAEAAADSFCDYLKTRGSSKKLFSTLRFSPGYGDWSISAQESIMEYLGGCEQEIELTESGMLLPIKTITAAVGFSETAASEGYPVGEKGKGFCSGDKKCSECTTWECRK